MGAEVVKDDATLGGDRRILKAFKFLDHTRPLPPSLLRESFVTCLRSSSFTWRKRLCLLTICQPWWNNFRGHFSVVRLHSSAPDNGSFRNPWCMTTVSSFRLACELGNDPWKGVVKPPPAIEKKKTKRSPSLTSDGSTQNYPFSVFDLSNMISKPFKLTHSPITLANLSSINLVYIFRCSSPSIHNIQPLHSRLRYWTWLTGSDYSVRETHNSLVTGQRLETVEKSSHRLIVHHWVSYPTRRTILKVWNKVWNDFRVSRGMCLLSSYEHQSIVTQFRVGYLKITSTKMNTGRPPFVLTFKQRFAQVWECQTNKTKHTFTCWLVTGLRNSQEVTCFKDVYQSW